MSNSTTDTYALKRKILNFTNSLSYKLTKPNRKFMADIVYGMLASRSCLLTDIADQLHERSKKVNVVERLSKHLRTGTPNSALRPYLLWVKKHTPSCPTVHIDDTDIVKPNGYKFESLGVVRDGSRSATNKNVYEKGYRVTEAVAVTKTGNPISLFSHIHSSKEKSYKSTNSITFSAMERAAKLFGKATFVMDRGYDNNKTFQKLDALGQDYVLRITKKRNLFYQNKWVSATELCNRRKGKIRMPLFYHGKEHTAYVSHIKARITASRRNVNLVLIYGITQHPMMLVTNKKIHSKDDVIGIAKQYFSRWRVEEYFRCKKQEFQFENFRVRKLRAINALNFYMTISMAFLAMLAEQSETNALKVAVIKKANPVKEKVQFCYYRLARGIQGILAYAHEGIRLWFRTKRPSYCQLRFRLPP